MCNINLNVDVGETKTLTFNTKDKYNSEDIVFNIAANDTLADWAKAATKPSYTWSEINNKPNFATVATSGSYNDLSNKPTLSTFGITATATELNYTDGVTSNIQTQLNNKVTTNSAATLTSLNINGTGTTYAPLTINTNNTTNNSIIYFKNKGVSLSSVGHWENFSFIANETNWARIGVSDAGVPQYWDNYTANSNKYTLLHEGNYANYINETNFPGVNKIGTVTSVKVGTTSYSPSSGVINLPAYATLDSTGKVPTSQLPSYVDDVEEYTNRASFPATGEKGKIYVDTTKNDIYRWTGSTYIKISGIIGAQGENGAQGYQGYTGIQGATGLQGKNGKNGFNFTGCFISSYSLYHVDQNNIGSTYTFNKSDFNISSFDNTNINEGDTILVTYIEENSIGVTEFIEHCYIKITRYIVSENSFTGVVLSWFKIQDGEVGAQGYQGYQGATGAQGTTGIQGFQGYKGDKGDKGGIGIQGYRGYQGLQGISGALATNHWYLDKANPEVTNNGSSKLIQLDTINDSIFAKLSNLTNGSLNGRSFIVNWTDSNGSAMINDLFGDFSEYTVPNQVRYHFYIQNMSKRESPVKIHWNSEFYTNVSHRPGWQPQIVLRYGECCKIEFVKFDDSHAWVDVELEDLIYDASTSAASENNEDNAASQIQAYCENNKLSYTLNKESHDIQFNLIDIIADICSKLK